MTLNILSSKPSSLAVRPLAQYESSGVSHSPVHSCGWILYALRVYVSISAFQIPFWDQLYKNICLLLGAQALPGIQRAAETCLVRGLIR